MLKRFVFYAVFIFVLVSCIKCSENQPSGQSKIIGGKRAEIPYQISLYKGSAFICGGSIINKNSILTAAHCVEKSFTNSLSVNVGSEILFQGKKHFVKRVIKHPRFDLETIDYDVCILKLKSPIKFNNKVKAVALPENNLKIPAGTSVTVSGWGFMKPYGAFSSYLLKVDVDIISKESCQKLYNNHTITERMICAAREKKDSCQGDSGGPLTLNNKLIGIVSWGMRCADPKSPGVYTNVSNLRTWIDENSV